LNSGLFRGGLVLNDMSLECRLLLRMGCTVRSSLELSDTQVYEPYIRALLGTAAHFFELFLNLKPPRNRLLLRMGCTVRAGVRGTEKVQGHFAHKKQRPPRALQ